MLRPTKTTTTTATSAGPTTAALVPCQIKCLGVGSWQIRSDTTMSRFSSSGAIYYSYMPAVNDGDDDDEPGILYEQEKQQRRQSTPTARLPKMAAATRRAVVSFSADSARDGDGGGGGCRAVGPRIRVTSAPLVPAQRAAYHASSLVARSVSAGARYDGSAGRSFPLVTARWLRENPDEVARARRVEDDGDDSESVVEDYFADRDGWGALDCFEAFQHGDGDDDDDKENQNKGPGAQAGNTKLGKLLEKTGEKLGSGRLISKGRKKRFFDHQKQQAL